MTMFTAKKRAFLLRPIRCMIGGCFCLLLAIWLAGCGRSNNARTGDNNTPIAAIADAIQTNVPTSSAVQNSTSTGYPAPSEIDYAAPNLGVVIDKEMKVLWVEPNSVAAKGGILIGDIINSVDNVAIASHIGDVKRRIWYATKDQKIKVKLTRNGKDVQVDVIPVTTLEHPTLAPGPVLPTVTPVASPDDYL